MKSLLASRLMPLPHTLFLEICSRCNLRCMMCPKTHGHVNTDEDIVMSREVFTRLGRLFPYLSHAELSGLWGEAMLPADLYAEFLAELKRHRISVTTVSNGTVIKDDLARRIVEAGLDRLMISVDACRPETYRKIRTPGRLEDVVSGLESLKEWKRKLSKNVPKVELTFLGMRSNIDELPDFVRFAHEHGAERIFLQALGEYEATKGESIALNDKALGRKYAGEAKRIADELGIEFGLQPPDQFEEDRGDRNQVLDVAHLRKACLDPWNKVVVTAGGNVLPCCSSRTSYGNLLDQEFEEIWYGPRFRELRRGIKSDRPPEMCRVCTGVAWEPASFKRDARQAVFWAGVELKRRYGNSVLFNAIKPPLKALRRLLAGRVRDPEELRGTGR